MLNISHPESRVRNLHIVKSMMYREGKAKIMEVHEVTSTQSIDKFLYSGLNLLGQEYSIDPFPPLKVLRLNKPLWEQRIDDLIEKIILTQY